VESGVRLKRKSTMAQGTYDIITVGGGLGGATLAKVMAEHGARVLVVERETEFQDRIRGEFLSCWGVAETQALGLYALLRDTCAHESPRFGIYLGSDWDEPRNLVATTPQGLPAFIFYHPTMQEVVLQAAANAGAEIRRGATVRNVKAGPLPSVEVEQKGHVQELQARLIVGADGRGSVVRKWGGFPFSQDPDHLMISGVLFDEMPVPAEDTSYYVISPNLGQGVPLFPQGGGRVRAYLVQTKAIGTRFQGLAALPGFIEESIRSGAPAEWYAKAKPIGPLATFDGTDNWVEHPYKGGVVLIGDAAATSDPSWGQGLCLTLRDVRVLQDYLLSHENWDEAGHAYAEAHDRHYGVIHTIDNWLSQMFFEIGSVAEARRAKALPLIARDPTRMLDHGVSGPELPADETVRRRFFGEE
jgi:2-polyprenyl-6-methoxyphenol hydroxylase-like FAD-dependent oxidoreductase